MNVYVVDNDPVVRETLTLLLREVGHQVQTFSKGRAFLAVDGDLQAGCLILDFSLPDIDGMAIQRALAQKNSPHSIIMLSDVGEIPEAVSAIRAGAVDFLCKPVRLSELLVALTRASDQIAGRQSEQRQTARRNSRLETLSAREKHILAASADGQSAKDVAATLGLSTRTVEMHRANIIRKLKVTSFSAALLLAQKTDGID